MKILIASTPRTGHVTFLKDSKFFFTLYHAGKVNIILHVVSLSFLFYGLAVRSVPLVLIGLFIIGSSLFCVGRMDNRWFRGLPGRRIA
jgi:hypothetical protein